MARFARFAVVALVSIAVSACTGTGFKIPNVSSDSVHLLEQSFAQNTKLLPTITRTDKQNSDIIAKVNSRFQNIVGPMCELAKTPGCYFSVAYNPEATINASTSGSHEITIYRGLLQYLQTEDEIAAVIGHEYGHVIADHVEETKHNAKVGAAIGGIFTAVLVGMAARNNPYYNPNDGQRAIEGSMKLGAAIGLISFSKEDEREADLLSAYMLARAGYDLDRGGKVWETLAIISRGQGGDGGGGLFDTHPANAERMAAWDAAKAEVRSSPNLLPSPN
jgi:predicted Zn-dependent protease